MNFKKRSLSYLPYVLIAVLVLIFFVHLFLPQSKVIITPDFGLSDLSHLQIPFKFNLAKSLKKNKIPFITANIGNGFPVYSQGETGIFNIFNLFFFKFFDLITAFNLDLVISFLIIGFFFYSFQKEIKIKTLPALISSTSFTFSFYLITQIGHINVLQSIAFFIILIFLLQKYISSFNLVYLILFSFALSQQIFSGAPQIVFISNIFLITYFIIFVNKKLNNKKSFKNKKVILQQLLRYGLFIFLGLGVAAVQLLPSKSFLSISNRRVGFSGDATTMFSYPPSHLLTLIKPFLFGNPAIGTYPPFYNLDGSIFWENTGYFGILALIFALLSIIFIKKNKYIKFFWLTTFFSFLLMTGKHSPIYFIHNFYPFNIFRVPSRFILIFIFSLTTLTGLFLNEVYLRFKKYNIFKKNNRFIKNKPAVSIILIFILILNLIDLYTYGYPYHLTVTKKTFLTPPKTVQFLSQYDDNKIFVFDLGEEWNQVYNTKGWQNPEKYLHLYNTLKANINLLWQIPSFNSYEILTSQRHKSLKTLINAQFSAPDQDSKVTVSDFGIKLLKQNSINYIITSKTLKKREQLTLVKTIAESNNSDVNIYQLQDSLPFSSFANKVERADTIRDFINTLNNSSFNQKTTIISDQDLDSLPEMSQNNSIRIINKNSDKYELELQVENDLYLSLRQSYLPGWQAFLNNKEVKIHPINLDQIAIRIPQGNHKLILKYQPKSFTLGAVITSASLISLLILAGYHLLSVNKSLKTQQP